MARANIKPIMDWTLKRIQSIPYRVSLRWVVYKLIATTDFYTDKKIAYRRFKNNQANWRKNFKHGWHPNTLADDTRVELIRTGGVETLEEGIQRIPDISRHVSFVADHFYEQEYYVELCFESRAMHEQFRYHTQDINLVPFSGDYTVEPKWRMAKRLERMAARYGKPVKILYFGDCDDKGQTIPLSAMADIEEWCSAPIELEVCGLTPEQVKKYDLMEQFDAPGQYQWEALDEHQAAELIEDAITRNLDVSLIEDARRRWAEEEAEWEERVEETLQSLVDGY